MVDAIERTHGVAVTRRWPMFFIALAVVYPLAAWRLSANPGHFVVVATVARPLTTIILVSGLITLWRALVPPSRGSRTTLFAGVAFVVVVSIGLSQIAQGFGGSYGDATVSEPGVEMRAVVGEEGGFPLKVGAVVSAEVDRGLASRRTELVRTGMDNGPVVVRIAGPTTIVVSTCQAVTTIEVDRETLDVVTSWTARPIGPDVLSSDGRRAPQREPSADACPHDSN